MQVNTVSDHVTHAVINNNKAREAQIANSAEFFNVLSNTLYSDKILAVVREVLCNAWDIHIQTGRTDKPVEVTLTDNKLTIRDYGTGIADDDIVDVYLTYGNSTKKLDGTQTGGFGLGSKAPWAYVDHFEITSYCDGKKTIYAASKSSGEVAGKPSVLPILTVPTDETGLMVSFMIKDHDDYRRFTSVIESIARFGEMNVNVNGSPIQTVAFSQAKHGFLMTKNMQGVSGADNNRIFIRYGNVIYPLAEDPSIGSLMRSVIMIVDKIGGRSDYYARDRYKIIFQAKPNTISVTPSRESLSMTEHTIASAKEILQDFINLYNKEMHSECLKTANECVVNTWIAGRPADLLTSNNEVPLLRRKDQYGHLIIKDEPVTITDLPVASRSLMSKQYPDFRNYEHDDIMMRLKALEHSGFGNRGKFQSFRKEYMKGDIRSDWFQRVMVTPLMRKLDTVPEMSGDKLLVYGLHDRKAKRYSSRENYFIEANKLSPRKLSEYMPFLRNFVVLSYNRIDIEDRLHNYPIMKFHFGKASEMFVYIVSRTAGKNTIAKEFFESIGMTVVDLTKAQTWEKPSVVLPNTKPAVAKPRKKGLPVLSCIMPNGIGGLRYSLTLGEDVARTETPEFIVQFNPRANSAKLLSNLNNATLENIVSLYGSFGAITVNDNQTARFKAIGIPMLSDWLMDRLLLEAQTNANISLAYSFHRDKLDASNKIHLDYYKNQLLEAITRSTELSKIFNIYHDIKKEDRQIMQIMDNLLDSYSWRINDKIKQIKDIVSAISINPNVELLANKINKSKLVGALQYRYFLENFKDTSLKGTKPAEKAGAIDLLLYALEG